MGTFSANKSVEFRQIDAHTDAIGIFLWRHHYWGAPFSGLRNWGDDALADEEVDLVVPIGERDCSRSSDAEWSGVGRQGDMELFPWHRTDVSVKHGWKLGHDFLEFRCRLRS